MNYSYVMGVTDNILKLENQGFIIEKDHDDYLVSFPSDQFKIWEKFILDDNNEKEILKLCCEFAQSKFNSIRQMLEGNTFYANQLKNGLISF